MNSELAQLALLLFGAVALGGLLPYTRRWSEEGLHALVALSAGIFLGAVFLHLVPELAIAAGHWDADEHAGHAHAGHAHGPRDGPGVGAWVWVCFAGGLVGLWFLERLFVHRAMAHGHGAGSVHVGEHGSHDEEHKKHELAWRATLFGLSVHALLTGLGLAGVADRPGHWALWSAMLLHKLTEGFSLGTLLRLAKLRLGFAVAVVLAFSLVAPGGLLLGRLLAVELGPLADLLTAFAAGTFLFVALFELLPEVLHGSGSRWARGALVLAGIALAGAVPLIDADNWAAWASTGLALFLDLAPFVLVGLVLVGALHFFRNGVGLARGAAARLPAAAAPRSAHLVAAPQTGPVGVLAGAAVFDPWLTLARPFFGAVLALAVGAAVRGGDPSKLPSESAQGNGPQPLPSGRFARALEHAVVEVVDHFAASLVCGVLVAAALFTLVPEAAFSAGLLGGPLAYALALLVGWPLGLHPLAATPIAAALLARGVSPGAVLVFLLAAPALNRATYRLLRAPFGTRVAKRYLVAVAGASLLAGLLFGLAHGTLAAPLAAGQSGAHWLFADGLREAAGAALVVMLLASFLRRLRRSGPRTTAHPPAGSAASG